MVAAAERRNASDAAVAVAGLRAAFIAHRAEVEKATARSLAVLDELDAWTRGGAVPDIAVQHGRFNAWIEATEHCGACGKCALCVAQPEEVEVVLLLDEAISPVLTWAAGRKADSMSLEAEFANIVQVVDRSLISSAARARVFKAVLAAIEARS
jgi:hypothetical protein